MKSALTLDWWKGRMNRTKQFDVVADTSVFVPPAIMRELWAHALAGAPNEACGLIGFRDGIAEKFLPCENAAQSVSQFDLRLPDPMALIDLHEAGYEVGCFHTHPVNWAEPSLTDLLNVGAWAGCPYLILAVTNGELGRWRITRKGEEVSMEPRATFTPPEKGSTMSRGRSMQTQSDSWRAPDGTRFPERDLIKESLTVRVFLHHFTKDGIPYDPYGCGFACGVKDAMDAPWTEIGKTIARIVVPDNEGGWVCVRGRLGEFEKQVIKKFDAIPSELTGAAREAAKAAVIPENGVLFTLRPIRKSDQKDSMRAAEKRSRQRKFAGVAKTGKSWKKSQRSLNMRAPFKGSVPIG